LTGDESFDVSAIVVNWNTRHLLDYCLKSLADLDAAGRRGETIVVDNGSTDGSAEHVATNWPRVRLITNVENLGYQRANNQAIRLSRGRVLLLINADARLRPGALDRMLRRMESDPATGVVGPRLEYEDGRFQRWTAGRAPDLRSAAGYWLFLERFSRSQDAASIYLSRDVHTAFRPDWVSSACMLVRREALDDVGLMDERYFVYMDDVDLCQRIRDAGWSVWYEPKAEAVHLMGGSSKQVAGEASPTAIENFNDYFRRRHGAVAVRVLEAMQLAGYSARAALYGARRLIRAHPSDGRKAREHLRNAGVVWRSARAGPRDRSDADHAHETQGQSL
jgi:hypothetical protein